MCEPTEVHPSSEKLDSTQEVELSTGRNDKNAAHLDVVTDPPPQPQQNDKEQTRGSVEEAEELSTGRDDKVTAQSGEAVNPPCQPQTDENEEKMGSTEVTEELSSGRDDSDAAQLGEVINLPPQPQTGETEKKMGNAEETEELSTGRDDKDTAQLGEVINPPPQPHRDEKEEKMGSTEVAEELSTGRDDKDTKQLGEVINTPPQPQRDEKEKKVISDIAKFEGNTLGFFDDTLKGFVLTVYLDDKDVLGIGTHSKVFKGRYENSTDVAIKRLSLAPRIIDNATKDVDQVIRELEALHKLDDRYYDNTVRYRCRKSLGTDLYIALERCEGTIDRYVKHKKDFPELTDKRVLLDIAKGVNSLHEAKICHRDIKPSNFLMTRGNKTLISDYGHAKATQDYTFSQSGIMGTIGWMSPEIGQSKISFKSDIFQTGCVFYHLVTGGDHPFDLTHTEQASALSRQINISNGRHCITEHIKELNADEKEMKCLYELIKQMVHQDPKERPRIADVICHPALWEEEKILKFFSVVGNYPRAKIESMLEKDKDKAIGQEKWIDQVPDGPAKEEILSEPRSKKPTEKNTIFSLIRVIRNKSEHWGELPQKVQKHYGGTKPKGYISFWTNAFPDLLMHTYQKLKPHKDSSDELREYYS